MSGFFAISAATGTVVPGKERRVATAFTVSNLSGRPLRGRARLVVQSRISEPWIQLLGKPEREFAAGATQQYTVEITVPLAAPGGSYKFWLDVAAVGGPDESYTSGLAISLEVPGAGQYAARRPLDRWVVMVSLAAVLGIAAILALLLPALIPSAAPAATATASATSTATASATRTATASATWTATPTSTRTATPTATATTTRTPTATATASPTPTATIARPTATATATLPPIGVGPTATPVPGTAIPRRPVPPVIHGDEPPQRARL